MVQFKSPRGAIASALRKALDRWTHPAKNVGPVKLAIIRSLKVALYAWSHPINRTSMRRRAQALLRVSVFQFRGRVLGSSTVTPLGTRSVIRAHPRNYATLKIVCANPPDYAEMVVWRNFLRPGDLFVDVGANAGTYSIWAADLGASVIALEPAEEAYNLLAENTKMNNYSIELHRAAAGPVPGTARFTQGLDDQNHIDSNGETSVHIVTIDSIIGDRQVAGMKVDVEGFEIDVLRGCERALSERRIALIQLEWNSTSQQAGHADRRLLANFLKSYGYSLYRPDETGTLASLADIKFGPDVFARPGTLPLGTEAFPA